MVYHGPLVFATKLGSGDRHRSFHHLILFDSKCIFQVPSFVGIHSAVVYAFYPSVASIQLHGRLGSSKKSLPNPGNATFLLERYWHVCGKKNPVSVRWNLCTSDSPLEKKSIKFIQPKVNLNCCQAFWGQNALTFHHHVERLQGMQPGRGEAAAQDIPCFIVTQLRGGEGSPLIFGLEGWKGRFGLAQLNLELQTCSFYI